MKGGLAFALIAAAAPAAAQELTLADAMRRADAGAYANRIADGAARTQSGEALRPWQGILPAVRVEAGYARTTDPIGTFGMTLRQRVITQSDFDPARLNHPPATTNHGAALVLEQPLLHVDAHLGRQAAAQAASALRAQAEWSEVVTRVDVVRAYYGAVLMAEQVATLSAAHAAADAHARQAEAMARQGLVTRSDGLLARVRAGEVETQLMETRGAASLAKRRLAVLLGDAGDTTFVLPALLPEAARVAALEALPWRAGTSGRSDVRAAQAGAAASRLDERRARTTLLPRVNAVARYDWNSPSSPFAGDENWTVAVMATWSPFAGASQLADMRAAAGRAAVASAQLDAARAAAELEAAAAANAWLVALERLRIAQAAVAQGAEAHRIVARKYEGGLATVVELLGAATAEMEARLRLAQARYLALVAAAERLQAIGGDPAAMAAVAGSGDSLETTRE